MKLGVKKEVCSEPVRSFGRAPGPSEHPIDIGPDHCSRVVERKERVEPSTLELALSGDAASLPFNGVMDVGPLFPGLLDPSRILGVLIRKDLCTRSQPFF